MSFCKIEVKLYRFGIAVLPINLIASIGGMSEWSMMMKGLDWRISYSLFLFGMMVFG